jgi:tripartite ATP-independent transporter DctP family solute receptor
MKLSLKRLMALSLGFTLVFGSCSNSSSVSARSASGPQYTFKLPHIYGEGHPNTVSADKMKQLVNERTKGAIIIETYISSSLGGEEEIYNGIRSGTIEMGLCGNYPQSDVPLIALIQLPFLFKNFEHAKEVLTGDLGREITAGFKDFGVKIFPVNIDGFRVITSNKRLESLADFKGFKLRTPPYENMVMMGQSLGCAVTPMPMAEVFSALQQHVIDGQENPYTIIRAAGWYEVQEYLLESRHVFTPNYLMMNEKLFHSLSPEFQAVLEECAKGYSDDVWRLGKEAEENDKKFMEEKGLKILYPDEKFRQEMRDAMQPVHKALFAKIPGAQAVVEKINTVASRY